MAGLQDMAPMVANRCVTKAVLRAHAGAGGRGFTAGMAAANHDNVELCVMVSLGCEACSGGGGQGSKTSGFQRNVSRETSPNGIKIPFK